MKVLAPGPELSFEYRVKTERVVPGSGTTSFGLERGPKGEVPGLTSGRKGGVADPGAFIWTRIFSESTGPEGQNFYSNIRRLIFTVIAAT